MDNSIIGIDLRATSVSVARIRNNKIEKKETEEIKRKVDEHVLVDQIARLIDQMLVPEVKGIGLGVPSVVDIKKGIVYNVQNIPSWEEVPLKSIYEEQFDLPVFINNDANCFVLGEKYFGKGKNYSSIAGLIIGSGMGAGLIFNENLYVGSNCGAGEIGMLPYRKSIMEHYCSECFFEQRGGISAFEAHQLALNGNQEAISLFNELGVHIGISIESIIYAYDPEIIILGGSLSKGFEFFKDTMYSSLESFAYQNSLKNLDIKVSDDDFIALKGAAALVLDNQSSIPA